MLALLAVHYLEINLLLSLGFLIWLALHFWGFGKTQHLKPSQFLVITHLILASILVLPIILFLFPKPQFLHPTLQIWSAPTFHTRGLNGYKTLRSAVVSLGAFGLRGWTKPAILQEGLVALLLSGLLVTLLGSFRSFWKLSKIIRACHVVRKIGKVQVLASDEVAIPFSFWRPRAAYVVLPSAILTDLLQYRLAVFHEIQHHRQGDTRWVHGLQLMKLFFSWNPIIYIWEKSIATLQEFACDEALVAFKSVSPHAYGSCLIQTAEQCLRSHPVLVGTTGMAVGTSGKTLKRRIDMMFDYRSDRRNHVAVFISGTLALAILTSVAFASQGWVRDRRVTTADAEAMAKVASQGSTFPIEVNDSVVAELNRFIGTPDGRAFIKDSMERMQSYRSMIEGKIHNYSMPIELLAIPLIESGYQNIKSNAGAKAAGLWMFIAQTARNYELRVDDHLDDRMNTDLETDAAMRYLGANYLRFQDWQLAVLAYNTGESHVQKGIEATGSRDAWTLIDAGYDNDKGYLARVMAAVLILKNPTILN